MKISFGKIIPTHIFVNGHTANSEETAQVTNILCANLRRQKHYKNNNLIEQQRRMFNLGVTDYKIPKKEFENHEENNSSNVIPINIVNPNTNEKERFLVTGKDINTIKEIQEKYGDDRKKGIEPQKAYNDMQTRLNDLKKSQGTLLNKKLYVSASKDEDAKLKKEEYKINIIDFIS